MAFLKALLAKQNARPVKQPLDYQINEVLGALRTKIAELVKVKAAIAVANTPTYERILRLAELKGLVVVNRLSESSHLAAIQSLRLEAAAHR